MLAAYSSDTAEHIFGALETSGLQAEEEEPIEGEKRLDQISRESVVRLASTVTMMTKIAFHVTQKLLKNITGPSEQRSFDVEALVCNWSSCSQRYSVEVIYLKK